MKILLALVVLALVAFVIIVLDIRGSGKPEYGGSLVLDILDEEVTVYRDERGMPHIYAAGEADLYRAVGYVMAQERLWQMDLIRRATEGTLSEIFGDDYIETDLFLRSLKMSEKSAEVVKHTAPEILECMQNFVDGVNSYISQAGNNLPPEFRILRYKPQAWTPENTANIIGYMGWDLASGNLSGDISIYRLVEKIGEEMALKMIPYYDFNGAIVYGDPVPGSNILAEASEAVFSLDKAASLGLTSFSGSNNWAVDGGLTESGLPLFSNDMHLGLSSPGIWMQMHQVVPGVLNVTGVVVPGEPFVIAGHNESIAWGMTNLMVDDIDLYLETLNPERTAYLVDGEWRELKVEKETIVSKGAGHEREIVYTHRGPVISAFRNIDDAELSMRWSGNDSSNEVRSVYLLNRARTWDEFNDAISSFNAISQNFIYADTAGNIGLHSGGGVAIRERHGGLIMPGDTSAYDWKGYVHHYSLPGVFNPADGRVSSANNKTVGEGYPYYIGTYFSMPYRINRIRQMLNERTLFTIDDFKTMITDRRSDLAATLIPLLLDAIEAEEMNGIEQTVLESLEGWDYLMSADSFNPTFLEYFISNLKEALLADDFDDFYSSLSGNVKDYYLYMVMSGEHNLYVDNCTTEDVEGLAENLRSAFRSTIVELVTMYGASTENWRWGDIHTFSADHPLGSVAILDRVFGLNSRDFGVGGSNHTVSPYSYGAGFNVNHGASERHIYDPADWDRSLTIIPTGNSGVPSSPFYLSQTELYCNDGFYPDLFSEEAVTKGAVYTLILKPDSE